MTPEANGQTAQAQPKIEAQPSPQAAEELPSAALAPGPRGDGQASDQTLAGLVGLVFYVVVGLVIWAFTQSGRGALAQKPWLPYVLGAALFLLITIPLALPRMRAWLKQSASRQGFVLTFFVVPLLLGVVIGIVFTPPVWQFGLIRVGFILVACLLPAAMYYLFIVTRKGSLLNEFVANMARLGLLSRQWVQGADGDYGWESEVDRVRRVDAYLQKFEAAFGPIPDEAKQVVMQPRDRPIAARGMSLTRATVTTVFVSEAAVPVLVATFLMALLWVVTLPPVSLKIAEGLFGLLASGGEAGKSLSDELAPWWHALRPNLSPVTAAFLGAYFFSLQLLFHRYVRRDLRPSAYVGTVLRILLAVIGVWVLQVIAPVLTKADVEVWLVFTGFVVGVFPRVFLQIIAGLAKKLVPTAVLPSLQSQLPISDLDGLTVWHEARLEDEDIENVPNMATADLLELMINTRFPADRLVDWVDQAILYTCLGPQDKKSPTSPQTRLRAHGIRTASAFTEAYRRAAQLGDGEKFEKILSVDPRSEVRSISDAIDTIPNTRLIRVWRRLVPASTPGVSA